MAMYCKYCGKEFTKKAHTGIQKFCSKKCREYFFHITNPERRSEYNKKYRLKNKEQKKCVVCKENIPKTSKRFKYCSDTCSKKALKAMIKRDRKYISDGFVGYKQSLGCCLCGYSRCGASLVYHHIYVKDRRITSKLWYYKTELFEGEMKKCILICSNCHKELHFHFGETSPKTYKEFFESMRPFWIHSTEYMKKYFEIIKEKIL